jgi:hypothetical protein
VVPSVGMDTVEKGKLILLLHESHPNRRACSPRPYRLSYTNIRIPHCKAGFTYCAEEVTIAPDNKETIIDMVLSIFMR